MSPAGPILLGVDTSTAQLALGLARGGELVAELTLGPHRTHATVIAEALDRLLKLVELQPGQIDGLVAGTGPGSFTGLRIGLATVKGLATALAKPVVAVSSLQALALQAAGQTLPVAAMIDARRRQIYGCCYRLQQGRLEPMMDEQAVAPADFLAAVPKPCVAVGSGALLYRRLVEQAGGHGVMMAPESQHHLRPASLMALGWAAWQKGRMMAGDKLLPVYLRKADAEIGGKPPARS